MGYNDDGHRGGPGRGLVPERGSRALTNYTDTQEVLRAYPVEEDETSIRLYIDVIFRRKKIILAFFLIVLVTTIIGTLLSTPIYKATAKLEISLENPKILNFDQVLELDNDSAEFYETQYLLLKSSSLIQQVIDNLNLAEHPEFTPQKEKTNPISKLISGIKGILSSIKSGIKNIVIRTPEDKVAKNDELAKLSKQNKLVRNVLGRISISPIGNSRLINISFEAKDKQLAAEAVNGLADNFILWILNRKVEATKQGRDFLKKQIYQTQINLENSEHTLNDYAEENNIVSLDENMNLIYHTFSTLNDAVAQAEKERLEKESLYNHVLKGNIQSLPQVVNDLYIQNLKAEHTKYKSEYSKMSATFKPGYPALKEIGAQVAAVERKIQEAQNSIAASIESDYRASLKKEQTLKKRFTEQEGLALALNERSVQYNILKREVDSNKSIYDSLLQRLKETEVSAAIKSSNIQVVDYASIPLFPYKPHVALNLLFGCIIGLAGGILIAFFMEHLDNTVRSTEEVRDKLRLPILGGIYELEKGNKENIPVEKSFLMDPRSHIAEAFRTIRTSLMLSTPGKPPRTILVTSCFPAEGKTTVAINLASSFAQAGNKVILLEADLRRPRIGQIFESNGNGLSSYLTGNANLEDVIKEGAIPNLSTLTVGQLPVNPAELLGSVQMTDLIEILRNEYDYVIIDGPPALGFVDAHLVSNIVDGVALVVRASSTPRTSIRELVDKLYSINANFLGVIVNGIELNHGSYYYKSYSYYYGSDADDIKPIEAPEDPPDSSNINPFQAS